MFQNVCVLGEGEGADKLSQTLEQLLLGLREILRKPTTRPFKRYTCTVFLFCSYP